MKSITTFAQLLFLVILWHLPCCVASSPLQNPLGPIDRSIAIGSQSGSHGCQLHHLPESFRNKTVKLQIKSGDQNRTFHVFIPDLYQPGVPTPIILNFHGYGKTAVEQEKLSELVTNDKPRFNPGWIIVSPQGLKRAWEGAPYAVKDAGDLAFMGHLLDFLEVNLCVDTSRVYATGKSNGGGFVGKLACSAALSARIAAFAPVSAPFYTAVSNPCNPARKIIPIIDFHGMADTVAPYWGGDTADGYHRDAIPQVLGLWAQRQGCHEPMSPTSIMKKPQYWKQSWSCGTGVEQTIVAYNITGLKHAWPSTHPNDDSSTATVLDATPIIIEFFSRWTLAGHVI